MLGNEFKTIDYRFERNFLNKVGRVSSNLLEVAQIIDHTTTRGFPKTKYEFRGFSCGGINGWNQPLGLVRERIPLSVGLGSHTRQVGTAHKCARSSLATLDTVSRHRHTGKTKRPSSDGLFVLAPNAGK